MAYTPPANVSSLSPAQWSKYFKDAWAVATDPTSSANDKANADAVRTALSFNPSSTKQTPEQIANQALNEKNYDAANHPEAAAAVPPPAPPVKPPPPPPPPTPSPGVVVAPKLKPKPVVAVAAATVEPDPAFRSAREPKVVATIGAITVPVTEVTLVHTINTLPYAEFSVALDNNPEGGTVPSVGGVKIDLENMNQLGKILQQKIYNSFTLTPDVIIKVTAGDDKSSEDKLVFTGFLGNPSFQVVDGQFVMVCTAIHSMARLQAFNPSIYQWTGFYGTNTLDDPFAAYFGGTADTAAALGNEKTNSIAARLWTGLYGLMKDFENLRGGVNKPDVTNPAFVYEQNNPSLYEPVQWNVHALNKAVQSAVYKVLDVSAPLTEIEGLTVLNYKTEKSNEFLTDSPFTVGPTGKLAPTTGLFASIAAGTNSGFRPLGYVENPDFADNQLHRTLFDVLAGSSNMLDALLGVLPPFLFQFNTQWGDNAWIEHLQPMEVPQSMIVVPIEALSLNLASAFELPLLQVIVRGPGSDFYVVAPSSTVSDTSPVSPTLKTPTADDAQLLYQQSMNMFGRYPRKVPTLKQADGTVTTMPGRYMYVDAPSWVCSDFQRILPPGDLAQDPAKDDTSAAVDNQATTQARYEAMGKARIPFLNYIARHVFNDMFLGRAIARIKIPLCLTPQVGRTYFVRGTGQESSIYIGYLESVTHTVKVSGQGAVAETELVFSHVRARDAVLEPLSLGKNAEGINTKDDVANLKAAEDALSKLSASGVTQGGG